VDTSAPQSFTITINSVNDAPVVTFTEPTGDTQTLDENKTTTRLYKYTVTDVDNANPTVTESCGSGGSLKPDETSDPTQNSFRCLFADDATTTVSVTANDGESTNNTGSDSIAVTVNNVAPKVNLTGPTTANEGETKTYSFTITDPGADTFSFPANYPTCGAHGNLVGTPATGDGQFQCTFPDGDNFTDVAVKVADDNGGVSVADTEHVEIITVAVANVNPTVTVPTTNQSSNEGASATFTLGSFSDPGPDSPWAVDVDWGDSSTHGSASMTSTGSLGTMNHTYADNGPYTVSVNVTDKNGGSETKSFTVNVSNIAPTITDISVSPLQALIGHNVTFSGTATDPSSVDTAAGFTWQWSKDGVAQSGVTSKDFQTSFSTCGQHSVSATAKDKDGGVSPLVTKSNVVNVSQGSFKPPVDAAPYINTVQKGRVIPVKISVGCGTTNLTGLTPSITLVNGDISPGSETTADEITAYSTSAADSTGWMRPVDGGYIYNLQVPNTVNTKYTIRVNPFGTQATPNPTGSAMYALLQTHK
jgi:hypothetical protein